MIDCVSMETRTCIFGYGGIRVKPVLQTILFQEIKPPQGVGTRILDEDGNKIGDWEYTGNQLSIMFNTLTEVKEMFNLLSEIEKNQGGSFTFKNVTLDFTTYHQESVRIIKAVLEYIKMNMLRLIAC